MGKHGQCGWNTNFWDSFLALQFSFAVWEELKGEIDRYGWTDWPSSGQA